MISILLFIGGACCGAVALLVLSLLCVSSDRIDDHYPINADDCLDGLDADELEAAERYAKAMQ